MSSVAIQEKTKSFTIGGTVEIYLLNAGDGSITATLPTIVINGDTYILKRVDSNASATVTVAAANGNTIQDQASQTIKSNEFIRIVSYGTDWIIIG